MSRSRAKKPLVLPEHLTLPHLGELRGRFASLLEAGDARLDGSGVARVDAAGLQLLFALQQAAADATRRVLWESPSAALRETATLLGLAAELGLEAAPRAC